MQTLGDAIAFRRAPAGRPCAGCAPRRRCPDHATDTRLITSDQRRHQAAYLQVCAGLNLDPARAAPAAPDGDTAILTAEALSVAMLSKLREQAAAGPVLVDLGDGPALYVLDGDALAEYPLIGPSDAPAARSEN